MSRHVGFCPVISLTITFSLKLNDLALSILSIEYGNLDTYGIDIVYLYERWFHNDKKKTKQNHVYKTIEILYYIWSGELYRQ